MDAHPKYQAIWDFSAELLPGAPTPAHALLCLLTSPKANACCWMAFLYMPC